MDNIQHIGGSSHDDVFSIANDIVESTPLQIMTLRATKRHVRSNSPTEDANVKRSKKRSERPNSAIDDVITKRLQTIFEMCEQSVERQLFFEQYLQDICRQLNGRNNNNNMTFREELQSTLEKHTESLVNVQDNQASILRSSTNILTEQVCDCNELRDHLQSCQQQLTFLRNEVKSLTICNNRLNAVVTRLSRITSQAQNPLATTGQNSN